MKMTVKVTAEHIKNGGRWGLAKDDPIELAIAEVMPKTVFDRVYAGPEEIILWDFDGMANHVATPDAVRTFIVRFDNGQPVEPFEFDLEV